MGRIKTRKLKSVTKQIFSKHEDEFGTDFQKNKEVASKYMSTQSKKLRNIISGYATRLKKAESKKN